MVMEYLVNGNQIIINNKLHIELLKNDTVRCYFEKVNEKFISIYPKKVTALPKIEKIDNKIIIHLSEAKILTVDDKYSLSLNDYLTLKLEDYPIDDKPAHVMDFDISNDARVMGLGDKMGALDKRGYHYRSWATDDPVHQDELYESLYKAISYLFVKSNGHYFALYFPSTYPYEFDIDKKIMGKVLVYSFNVKQDFFLFYGDEPKDIISSYSSLVGRPYMVRLKMLGNQQSRWSYENEKLVRDVFKGYLENKIPLDYIHLDIDYMNGYRCFTVNKERFPNLKQLSDDLKKEDVEIVAINDAGIKQDDDYDIYRYVVDNDLVIKNADGSKYIGKVWPGESVFPNYFDPKTKKYFGDYAYKFIHENGISAIWNDMNEPTSFFGPLPLDSYQIIQGKKISHEETHNIYGEHMVRCFVDTFRRDNIRPFLITRAANATTPQYTIVWGGDNFSLWHHLKLSIPQLLSLCISNFMFAGDDIGGFGGDGNKELLIRWCEGNIFIPFFRNHSSLYTKAQEPFAYDKECTEIYRKFIQVRYDFIPYLYDLVYRMNKYGEMIMRPLFYNYPEDKVALDINDEYMVGESVLHAPIVDKNTNKRIVYLPKGRWINYFTSQVFKGEKHYIVDLSLDETGIYIKKNSIIPMYENLLHLEKEKIDSISFRLFGSHGKYQMYEDDGKTLNHEKGEYNIYDVSFNKKEFTLKLKRHGYQSPYKKIKVYYGDKKYEVDYKGEDIIKISL